METKEKEESFVEIIMRYESNTFSAKGSKITKDESFDIANNILSSWIENNLDGEMITDKLMDIREVEEQGELYK